MNKNEKPNTINRFSIVDVIVDILLVATALVAPIGVPDLISSADTGFLTNLAQLALLFVGYFGLALYVARMYYAAAVRTESKWDHKVLHSSRPLTLFTILFVINILVSAYNIMQTIAPPVFTALLLIVEGLVFGFIFGLDHAIERHRASDPKYAIPADNIFSQSLLFIPYLILTFILLYPMDYISLRLELPLLARLIMLIGSCAVTIILSGKLNRIFSIKLQMTSHMNFITIAAVSLLMVVGFMGLNVLEAFAKNPVTIYDSSIAAHLVFLFFFGIVPIRFGTILFSRTIWLNRIIGIVALSFYLATESGLLQIDWLR